MSAASEKLRLRPLVREDQQQLWRWLHIALWDPPPAGLRPIEVLQNTSVRIYAEDWGRDSDLGLVASVNGHDAGACWMRTLPTGVGAAFVDQETPQLGIALEHEYQRRGYGGSLMAATLAEAWSAGHAQVSLTVHPENPAIALYERCGFSKIGIRNTYHLMLARRPK